MFRRDYGSADNSHAEEILRRLRAAERLMPNDADAHCQLGKAYRWLERWREALGESESWRAIESGFGGERIFVWRRFISIWERRR